MRDNGQLSKKVKLENGVPQGSVLSVTFFLATFNDVTENLSKPVKNSKFADNVTTYCRAKDLQTSEKLIQKCLNSLQDWSNITGFKFSTTKTKCIIFSKNKFQSRNPVLHMSNIELIATITIKILGIILDKNLTWLP